MLVSYFISLTSVLLFCGCCYALMKSITAKIPVFNHNAKYSKAALRVARGYRVMAWSILAAFFLMTLVTSFLQVFNEL